jgi:hypothetical protein
MSNPSAEVKCRHCGEVITLGIDGKWRDYVHPGVFCSKARSGQYSHEPPIRTMLSAEDRERLDEAVSGLEDWMRTMGQASSSCLGSVSRAIKAVLANAGGAE